MSSIVTIQNKTSSATLHTKNDSVVIIQTENIDEESNTIEQSRNDSYKIALRLFSIDNEKNISINFFYAGSNRFLYVSNKAIFYNDNSIHFCFRQARCVRELSESTDLLSHSIQSSILPMLSLLDLQYFDVSKCFDCKFKLSKLINFLDNKLPNNISDLVLSFVYRRKNF